MDIQTKTDKVRKESYIHQVFCWIERDETEKVMKFFDTYPQFVNRFLSPNNWSPLMYAVRYGNFQLVDYFIKTGHHTFVPNINSNTLVHAACFGNDPKMLLYLLHDLKQDPNPPNGEPSPIRYCIKQSNQRLLEILIHYGAYYIFDDVYNNLEKKDEEAQVYVSLLTGKEVPSNQIVKDTDLRDVPIKEALRWARVRNLLIMKKICETEKTPKLEPLRKILLEPTHYDEILKYCVNTGRSLLKDTSSEGRDNMTT